MRRQWTQGKQDAAKLLSPSEKLYFEQFWNYPIQFVKTWLDERSWHEEKIFILEFIENSEKAFKARSDYLIYRTRYEIAKTVKEINQFHKVLSQSTFLY